MNLLGGTLLVLLGASTLVLPVATVLLWTRLRGPRMLRAATRAVMVGSCQLASVLLVAAAFNDYGLFFKSWTDAVNGLRQVAGLGTTTGPRVSFGTAHPSHHAGSPGAGPARAPETTQNAVARSGRELTPASAGTMKITASYTPRTEWATHGSLRQVRITGAVSQLSTVADVYFPPEYFQARYRHTYFPASEVLSGYPGLVSSLVRRMHYPDVLLHAIAQHRARPMVLVMMESGILYPWDTECTNVPGGPQTLTFFDTDVPGQLAEHYRVMPTSWGVIGDSTGGYCAAKIAMLAPEQFSAGVTLSGYFFALHDDTTGDLWGGSRLMRDENDLLWRLKHQPAPPISLLVCTSPTERGPDGYAPNMRFVREVKAPMSVNVLTVSHGGHTIQTWDRELPTAIPWLSSKLPPPGPGPTATPGPGRSGSGDAVHVTLAGPARRR